MQANHNGPYPMLPEVWDLIFWYLDEPKDLLSVMRTCKEWQDILKPRRSLILLQNAFPFINKYLSQQCLFNCRGVCKQLQKTVDKLPKRVIFGIPDFLDFFRSYLVNYLINSRRRRQRLIDRPSPSIIVIPTTQPVYSVGPNDLENVHVTLRRTLTHQVEDSEWLKLFQNFKIQTTKKPDRSPEKRHYCKRETKITNKFYRSSQPMRGIKQPAKRNAGGKTMNRNKSAKC